jgi:hypothetical protein
MRDSETSPGSNQGVLALLALSPSEHGALCKVSQTFKQTNSDAKDVDVSGQTTHLSSVDTLAYC